MPKVDGAKDVKLDRIHVSPHTPIVNVEENHRATAKALTDFDRTSSSPTPSARR